MRACPWYPAVLQAQEHCKAHRAGSLEEAVCGEPVRPLKELLRKTESHRIPNREVGPLAGGHLFL